MARLPLPLSRAGFTPKVLAGLGWTGRAGDMMAEANGQGMLAWALDQGRYKLAALLSRESMEGVSHAGLAALAPGIDLSHVLDEDTTLPHLLLDLGAKAESPDRMGAIRWAVIVHGKQSGRTGTLPPSQTPEAWEGLIVRLIEAGADPNVIPQRQQDDTLLGLAAIHSPGLVPVLVRHGANLDWKNDKGQPYEAWVRPEALEFFQTARTNQERDRLETNLQAASCKPPGMPRL